MELDLSKLKGGGLGRKVAGRLVKKMVDGYVKSCYFMRNYSKIKEAGEMVKKYIDEDNKESFEYWCNQLNYLSRFESKIQKEMSKEAKKWKEKDEKRRKKFMKKVKKEGVKYGK